MGRAAGNLVREVTYDPNTNILSGTGQHGEILRLAVGGVTVASTVVDPTTGRWAYNVAGLNPGTHRFRISGTTTHSMVYFVTKGVVDVVPIGGALPRTLAAALLSAGNPGTAAGTSPPVMGGGSGPPASALLDLDGLTTMDDLDATPMMELA